MDFDTRKTLQELAGEDWGEPTYPSSLVITCHRLRRKPVGDFTPADLETMVGQRIGLECLMPVALQVLIDDPLVMGDYYPGDLLRTVLRLPGAFWESHPAFREPLDSIVIAANSRIASLEDNTSEAAPIWVTWVRPALGSFTES
jgi:hypothetical protein